MPRRRDQLPKAAINPRNSLEENLQLARHGQVVSGNLSLLFYGLLTHPDEAYRHDLYDNLLLPYLRSIIKDKKTDQLRQMAVEFELVVDHIAQGKPYNRTMTLAIEHELRARDRGEKVTAAQMAKDLRAKGVPIDARYARRIRRRFKQD